MALPSLAQSPLCAYPCTLEGTSTGEIFKKFPRPVSFWKIELRKVAIGPIMMSGGVEVKTIKGLDGVYAWLVDNFSHDGYDSMFDPQVAFVGPLKQAAKDFFD